MSNDAYRPDDAGPFTLRANNQTWRVAPDLNRVVPVSGAEADAPISLEPRVMQVLVALAERAGSVVPRDELLATVWADTVVNEEALTRAVSELRKTFGDRAQAPAVIETIRGTGYRCIATVEPVDAPTDDATDAGQPDDEGAPAWAWQPAVFGAVGIALIALVAATVWAAPWETAPSTPALLETQPFTSYPGQEREPALSPDGSRVAFGWTGETGDNVDLYLKQANTSEPLRLTEHPGFESFAAWSPDGTTIAFLRADGNDTALYTIPALGGTPRKLIDTRSVTLGIDWSPDGEALVFAERPAPDAPFRLVRLDLATRDTTALTQPPPAAMGDLTPRWSPDGQTLAFSRRAEVGGHDLYLARADGSELRPLTQSELSIRGLDWSADGQRLVYASYQGGTFGLWQVDVESGDVAWLPTRAERIYNPSVAVQTGDLVYEELTYEKDIWQIDLTASAEGAPPQRPIITSTRWDCEAYYSPDGERLVFTSSRSGALELWLSTADGSNPVQLTDFGGAFVGNPRWSPDGEQIAFFATPEGRAGVYVMDVAGGTPQPVQPADAQEPPANYWVTSWSRDGERIYAASDRSGAWQLWRMRPDGTDLTQVTQDGGFAAYESVTGDTLFYSKRSARGLWMRPTGGGPETRVLDDLALPDWGNWAVTGDGLYFVRRGGDGTTVAFHDFATGTNQTVASIPTIASPSLEVSPDGQQLLYARIEQSNSDLIAATLE